MEPVKIYSASNRIESEVVQGILRNKDIPYMVKTHGAGGYLQVTQGLSVYGESIYVNEEDAEGVREMIEGALSPVEDEDAPDDDENENCDKLLYMKRRLIAGVCVGIFVISFVAAIVISLFTGG